MNENTTSADLERATVSVTPSSDGAPRDRTPIPAPGTVLGGKYRVEGVLGEGGMGVVLAAVHLRLDRKVALKLLRPEVRTDRHALRLVREARSASALRTPHVAELLDVESLDDGTPYLVLEHLEGETLAERLRKSGPLAVGEAAAVLVQAAAGVAEAHAAGIVHRDVKPSNLFLTRDDAGALLVKVLDFGIAKGASPSDVTLTGESAALGSPAYMSPEQTRGAKHVDARTDVWALGVTLFETLSGELPFGGTSAQAVAAQVAADSPRPLAELCPGLPPPVLSLVESCLQKDAEQRCPSALAFMDALAPFASESAAVSARGASSSRHASLRPGPSRADTASRDTGAGRRRVRWIAAGAATLVLAGVVVLARTALNRPNEQPATAGSAEATSSAGVARSFLPSNVRRVTFDDGCEEFPWWTPNGQSLVFDAAAGRDTRVFALDVESGARREITHEAGWQIAPSVSPRGDEIAYLHMAPGEQATYIASFDGSSRRRLSLEGRIRPSWSPDGGFVWVGNGAYARRLDARTGAVSREVAAPEGSALMNVLELGDGRVAARAAARSMRGGKGLLMFAPGSTAGDWLFKAELDSVLEISPDGRSAYVAKSKETGQVELWRVPLDGAAPEMVPGTAVLPHSGFRFSKDGRRVAWSTCRGVRDIVDLESNHKAGTLAIARRYMSKDWLDEEPNGLPGTSSVLVLSSRTGKKQPCVVDMSEREAPRCLQVGGLEVSQTSPSADGKLFAFIVDGKGVFVAPLDDSAPPRQLSHVEPKVAHWSPVISANGRDVYFTVTVDKGDAHVEVVPIAGGTPRRFFEAGWRSITLSPKGDVAAFLVEGTATHSTTPMILDLATKKKRPLSPELGEGQYSPASFDATGRRAAIVRTGNEVFEIDVASGRVLAKLDIGNDEADHPTWVGDKIVIARGTYTGDVWVADVAR